LIELHVRDPIELDADVVVVERRTNSAISFPSPPGTGQLTVPCPTASGPCTIVVPVAQSSHVNTYVPAVNAFMPSVDGPLDEYAM
jgi:hypothetical protein